MASFKIYKLDKDIDSAFNFEINYENISLVNTIETPHILMV